MDYAGMVHALEEIHRLLKPAGVLIDIHPVAEYSPLEIHREGKVDLVGLLEVQQWCIDFQQADSALAEVVRRGLLAVERKGLFHSLIHYDSLAELRADQMEDIERFARDTPSKAEAVPHAEALIARAEELLRAGAGDAELVLRDRVHISRLRAT
jgi:hypothetical protein